MDEKFKKLLEAQASKAEKFAEKIRRPRRSSLHTVIKTKEQAERFMKALKSA
jgi:hypothetical protein